MTLMWTQAPPTVCTPPTPSIHTEENTNHVDQSKSGHITCTCTVHHSLLFLCSGCLSVQVRCSKTGDLPSCEAVCAKTLACGRHDCDSICHPGPCSTCSVTMTMTCHCGRTQQTVLCGETKELEFSCQQVCNR